MSRTLTRWFVALGAVATMAATAAPASADAVIDPAPIGPNQIFRGLVNDQASQATIKVACPGPLNTGHPLPGQTVTVLRVLEVVRKGDGFTGSRADAVRVEFPDASPSVSAPVLLRSYGVSAPIPTSLFLPCGGSGRVVFVPDPTSPTARSAMVDVRYQNLGV